MFLLIHSKYILDNIIPYFDMSYNDVLTTSLRSNTITIFLYARKIYTLKALSVTIIILL